MTFRTQIHTKKFGKNGFRNLQGTMSHRPLTNTSSLKITAAYCTGYPSGYTSSGICKYTIERASDNICQVS